MIMAETPSLFNHLFSSIKRPRTVYEKVPNEDVCENEGATTSTTIPWAKRKTAQSRTVILGTVMTLVMVLAVSLVAIVLVRAFKPASEHLPQEVATCGHTPTEARNAGCRFEPMMSAWMPHECSFSELIEDNAGTFENWPFFSDEKTRHPIIGAELEGVRVGNYTKIYSSHGTGHDLHCLYAWQKLNWAVEKGFKLVDSKSRSLHHSTHCAKHIAQLLEEGAGYLPKEEDMKHVTAFPLLFLSCVPLV
ncbi:hypothetical protein F5Y03DRAFT_373350 [Xylaria venustula]|nr:hypothetical protein F5Y03DRAFT_373350 [Xylaria venustula]